ncbi:MAG: hypothetical protein ACAH88_19245 [Roseimicrobium sp.]
MSSSGGTDPVPECTAEKIEDVLLNTEDYLALSMWEEASAALDSLPDPVKDFPDVAIVRLDLLIGQELWERGLMVGLALLESNSMNAELWFRIARLMAGVGNHEGALRAAAKCVELNPDLSCFLMRDRLLGPILSEAMTSAQPAP